MLINSAAAPTLAAIVIQLVLGLAVFQANPRRKSNQCFLLLSLFIVMWLGSLYSVLSARSTEAAALYIRQASAAAALILTAANLLRLSIQKQDRSWGGILRDSWLWLIAALAIATFCQTKFFLQGARFSQPAGALIALPVPVYGNASVVYVFYFVIAGLAVIINYARDARQATGLRRAEFAFILTGAVATLGTVLVAFSLGFFLDRSRLVWFAPFRILLFSLIVAYGIATQKIMDVGFFLRRAMSYALLTAYVLALYGLVWWLVFAVFGPLVPASARSVAHITAAVMVAFAMASARGVSQKLVDRLFVGTRGLDFRATVQKATAILESVTTLPDLLRRFASTIAEAVGTDNVAIFLEDRKGFVRRYSSFNGSALDLRLEISADGPLITWLKNHREPLILDELHRRRATAATTAIRKRLEELGVAAALGIFSREHLVGVMLLGPRLSGRIYGSVEQDALQILCGQLAVAIENAELFTEVQNAKIYNEILLQNLTTGVIAADADGGISVFNREAEKITGLDAKATLEKTIRDLPGSLCAILETTLQSGERQEDREIYLRSSSGVVYARASSSTFHSQDRQLLGALIVITDITHLKRLELQIRRSDRLASLGTLSAGMAHEIKNPLVSIKTFAQLLPERYSESDFRETFSNLIVHEINRIDSLVNQLLRFARPAKPFLRPMRVHEILDKTLLLIQHRLYQKEIKLTKSWEADIDTTRADADQLEQVFLNFFLNAMDAMRQGGELTVTTKIRSGDVLVSQLSAEDEEATEALCISIRDTGDGIRAEDIPHVFDPFFTTKDYGTGLGLSVVHGIIEEHCGQIEVESELSKGTVFHILLPLVRFNQEVAVA
ncbi:MAG: hypothetical protein DME86_03580 [Verrucomicrobia bacterium]|nr:MAG: hypothetical protein DME86_03580 [Verrucomicrobiota bacterium]